MTIKDSQGRTLIPWYYPGGVGVRLRHGSSAGGGGNPQPPTGDAPLGWLIDEANSGLAAAGVDKNSLPLYTGPELVPAGTTISLQKITTTIELSAGGITLDRCWIQPATLTYGFPVVQTCGNEQNLVPPTPVTLRFCDIDGTALTDQRTAAFAHGFYGIGNLYRNRIYGVGSGISVIANGKQLSAVYEGNYIHQLVAWGNPATTGNHADGLTIRGFDPSVNPSRTLTVLNNRIDASSGNDTGALFIQAYSDDIGNVDVEGNYLEGNGYCLILEDKNTVVVGGMTADNNRFRPTQFGAGYTDASVGWDSFTNGYIYDPGNPPSYAGSPVIL